MSARNLPGMAALVVAIVASFAIAPSSASAQSPEAIPPTPPGYAPAGPSQPYAPAAQPRRPRSVPYEEGMPIPAGAHIETRPRWGLVIAGGAIFLAAYLGAVFTWMFDWMIRSALGDDDYGFVEVVVPIVGPWLALSDADAELKPLLIADSVVQVAGLTIFVLGFAIEREILVFAPGDGTRVALMPAIGPRSAGLTVAGVF